MVEVLLLDGFPSRGIFIIRVIYRILSSQIDPRPLDNYKFGLVLAAQPPRQRSGPERRVLSSSEGRYVPNPERRRRGGLGERGTGAFRTYFPGDPDTGGLREGAGGGNLTMKVGRSGFGAPLPSPTIWERLLSKVSILNHNEHITFSHLLGPYSQGGSGNRRLQLPHGCPWSHYIIATSVSDRILESAVDGPLHLLFSALALGARRCRPISPRSRSLRLLHDVGPELGASSLLRRQ